MADYIDCKKGKIAMDFDQFIKAKNVRIKVDRISENPNVPDWRDATHYKCVLKNAGRQMTVYFSQGYGITEDPTAKSVLYCLQDDCCGYQNSDDFEGWCGDHGFDADSRKGERLYKITKKQAEACERFFGDSYENFLWNVSE